MSDRHGWEDDVRPARYRHADTVTYEQTEEIVAAATERLAAAVDALREEAGRHRDATEGTVARFGAQLARANAVLGRLLDPAAWPQRSDLQLEAVVGDLGIVLVQWAEQGERLAALERRVDRVEYEVSTLASGESLE